MRPDERYDPLELKNRVIVPLGKDGGLASAEAILSGRSAGQPFRVRLRYTDVFRRHAGGWQAVHIQVTRMPIPGGPATD
jgi:ketosteroid isomerase-like protein